MPTFVDHKFFNRSFENFLADGSLVKLVVYFSFEYLLCRVPSMIV